MKKYIMIFAMFYTATVNFNLFAQSNLLYFEANVNGNYCLCKKCNSIDSTFNFKSMQQIRPIETKDSKYTYTLIKYYERAVIPPSPCKIKEIGNLEILNQHDHSQCDKGYFNGSVILGISRFIIDSIYNKNLKFELENKIKLSEKQKEIPSKESRKVTFFQEQNEKTKINGLTNQVDFNYEKTTSTATCSYCDISKTVEIIKPNTIKFNNTLDVSFLLIIIDLINTVNSRFQGFIYMGWNGIFPAKCDISRTGNHNIEVTSTNTSIIQENVSREILNEKLFEFVYQVEVETIEKKNKEIVDNFNHSLFMIQKKKEELDELEKMSNLQSIFRAIDYGQSLGINGDTNSIKIISNSINRLTRQGYGWFLSDYGGGSYKLGEKYYDSIGRVWTMEQVLYKYALTLLNTGKLDEAIKVMQYVLSFRNFNTDDFITFNNLELMGWIYIMAGERELGLDYLKVAHRESRDLPRQYGVKCVFKIRLEEQMSVLRERFPKNKNISKKRISKIISEYNFISTPTHSSENSCNH